MRSTTAMPHHKRAKQQTQKKGRGPSAGPARAVEEAAAPPADLPSGLVEAVAVHLRDGGDPAAAAEQIAASPTNLQAPLLQSLARDASTEALVPALVALLQRP